jgi:hypothetical protein
MRDPWFRLLSKGRVSFPVREMDVAPRHAWQACRAYVLQGTTSSHAEGVADSLSDRKTHDLWQARDAKGAKEERASDI